MPRFNLSPLAACCAGSCYQQGARRARRYRIEHPDGRPNPHIETRQLCPWHRSVMPSWYGTGYKVVLEG